MMPHVQQEVVDGLSKSVELLVNLQWDLADLGTLDVATKDALTAVTEYHLQALALIDPVAAANLLDRIPTREERAKDLTGR